MSTNNNNLARLAIGALMLFGLVTNAVLVPGSAVAAELSDYMWKKRPLLLFTPTDSDPRLNETLASIEASRCDFLDRDMVIGVVAAEGNSTLDSQAIAADQSQRLATQYAVDEDAFSAVLIGKDGGEKLRIDQVPDLKEIYAVIDGMPMRSREMREEPNRC